MRHLQVVASILLVVGIGACSSSYPTEVAPGVKREAKYLFYYEGPEASAELDIRLTRYNVGDQWLLAKLSLASERGAVDVPREAVRLRSPDGKIYPLIDQGRFREMWGMLRGNLERHNPWSAPTDSFMYARRPCEHWLLAPTGAAGSFFYQDPLIVNANQWCTGPLVFEVPVGVQPGRWTLMVDFPESGMRIPFELGAE